MKIYAVTQKYNNGREYFWDYFPTKEAMQKMYDEEIADGYAKRKLLIEEINLPELKCKDVHHYYENKFRTRDNKSLPYRGDIQKIFADVPVIDFFYEDRGYWAINHSYFVLDVTREQANRMIADHVAAEKEARRHEYDDYLNSPFAKGWLRKMQYTERTDEYGHKFLFIAIKCGYKKMSDESFQKLCNAICMRAYGNRLRMTMWIGGKVNWTMFYERPDHVNGSETFFCGVVGEDDFSPEDFDKNHAEYSFENASRY